MLNVAVDGVALACTTDYNSGILCPLALAEASV